MNKSTAKLKAISQTSEKILLSDGREIEVQQIRPFAEHGYSVIALIDSLDEYANETFSMGLVKKAVSKLLNPANESHEHFKNAVIHVSGVEVENLTLSDLVLIVAKAVEVNVSFFTKALPSITKAVQAIQ